jgi:transposase
VAGSVWRVREELWEAVEPLLPEHPPDPRGGRPRVDDRVCFNAIVFVLFTGIPITPTRSPARISSEKAAVASDS